MAIWATAVLYIAVLLLLCAYLYSDFFKKTWRWLKGSRVTYYIYESGFVKSTTKKLRTPADRIGINMKPKNQGVIEINQGWFRPPSTIYGDFHIGPWEITKAWRFGRGDDCECVNITDTRGLRVDTASGMINTYPSLQAMLDRIAELEKEHQVLVEGAVALRLRILGDKQRFRSPAVQQVREYLEMILKEVKKEDLERANPEAWGRRFVGQRPENATVR